MDRSSELGRRRQDRIERAVRELTQAIARGEGVDLALDHLHAAKVPASRSIVPVRRAG